MRLRGHAKSVYSAWEILKAHVSSEGRMNVLLWYPLVGCVVGLLAVKSYGRVSGAQLRGSTGPPWSNGSCDGQAGWSHLACAEEQFDHGKAGENGQYSYTGSTNPSGQDRRLACLATGTSRSLSTGSPAGRLTGSEPAQCTVRPA